MVVGFNWRVIFLTLVGTSPYPGASDDKEKKLAENIFLTARSYHRIQNHERITSIGRYVCTHPAWDSSMVMDFKVRTHRAN